jgi:hypothetical protein
MIGSTVGKVGGRSDENLSIYHHVQYGFVLTKPPTHWLLGSLSMAQNIMKSRLRMCGVLTLNSANFHDIKHTRTTIPYCNDKNQYFVYIYFLFCYIKFIYNGAMQYERDNLIS